MRIAYLNTLGIPARYGGFETCVEEVSTRLARKGHDITVYCASRSAPKHSSYKGVKLVNVPGASNKFLDFPLRSFLSTIDATTRDLDIFHYYGTDSWIFAFLPRILAGTVVMSLDGLVWNRSSYSRQVRAALRVTSWVPLYLARATVVDSCHVRRWYLKTYGKAPIYIPYGAKVSPRGSDLEVLRRFGVEENEYSLFVGRLVPEKGVHHLIRAFSELGTQSKLQLVIVGGNPYGSTYELSLKRMAGNNRVRFLGYVYGSDMENLFKGAYFYVTASELEGTSPALLSAMGFGNCVLVSNIPENLETIGDAGVAFRSGDVQDLRGKMLRLISDPRIVRIYREKAVERVAALYSWDSVADRIEGLYSSLVENGLTVA
jgi:glycosyltransferase involved in cell wall biosynthesis